MAKRNFVGAKGARILRRVARHILAEPLRYDQNATVEHGIPGEFRTGFNRIVPECGTVACIGGWIALLGAKNPKRVRSLQPPKLARTLGVPLENMCYLIAFVRNNYGWPEKHRTAYNRANTPRQRAKVAARRIEHFIKTGE
jgi:hypothetical protein